MKKLFCLKILIFRKLHKYFKYAFWKVNRNFELSEKKYCIIVLFKKHNYLKSRKNEENLKFILQRKHSFLLLNNKLKQK